MATLDPSPVSGEGFLLRAVIFANGELAHPDLDRSHLRPEDWLIAADGGNRHCRLLGLAPRTLIGDFDSLTPTDIQAAEQSGIELVRHPSRKDQTDLELAIRYAFDHGADEILILGALGARWDQSLANLLLPTAPGLEQAHIRLLDGRQEILLIHAGRSLELRGRPGDTVSLIPLAGDARGVTTQGLEYALRQGTLPFGATLGVSNVLIAASATVTLAEGLLLCIVLHEPEALS